MLPSSVGRDSCRLASRWTLDATLADMLTRSEDQARAQFGKYWPGLYIISGHRSLKRNAEVGGVAGSFHTACPSLAADLRVGTVAGLGSDEVWAILGGIWRIMGGRWGGTFSTPDPNHFDVGGLP